MKRIVICCDGTWNSPENTDEGAPALTNVVKLHRAVKETADDGVEQVALYYEGVGTSGSWLRRLWDGYTGSGVSRRIRGAYRDIIEQYEPGDQLFLFGFSRGAFTARSLTGLIRKCGILRRDAIGMVGKAFRLYRSRRRSNHPRSDKARQFRQKYAVEVVTPIEFIGVWDTVGALGNPLLFDISPWNRFHDTDLSTLVRNAFQAVAIDEKRKAFRACLWKRQLHPAARAGQPLDDATQSQEAKSGGKPTPSEAGLAQGIYAATQRLEQVWFCGTHSNVGGGYAKADLSEIALQWMIDRARECGLGIDYQHASVNFLGVLRESWESFYRFFAPYHRPIVDGRVTRQTCENIHPTVRQRYKNKVEYRPPNLASYYKRHPEERPMPT